MSTPRVRFAPSPTGFMHLGNVRAALMNYLFAKQKGGTFILRIEDTDNQRNFDEAKKRISEDLAWLGLSYDEGPDVGGNYGPYEQSARNHFYEEKLQELIGMNRVYRCFCTSEELEARRAEQLKSAKPPRYERNCLNLGVDEVAAKISAKTSFIWRFKINNDQTQTLKTLSGENVVFKMENFSDFALSRGDGSFTFLFVNFVDDFLMKITHVIRGEDHLSNTALQAALYDAFGITMPIFWHLPIICNNKGEKLSKRDFGFSLTDLRNGGFMPEAIVNYMAIMGTSFAEEIQSLQSLTQSMEFEKMTAHGGIHYDIEKLTWVNHKWIGKLSLENFITRSQDLVESHIGKPMPLTDGMRKIFTSIQPETRLLTDVPNLVNFYFRTPDYRVDELNKEVAPEKVVAVQQLISEIAWQGPVDTLNAYKAQAKIAGIATKELLVTMRFLLTGNTHGLGIVDLFTLLEPTVISQRLNTVL